LKPTAGKASNGAAKAARVFQVEALLEAAGSATSFAPRRGAAIFRQGEACEDVMYVQTGSVKLSVRSTSGKEAVVAMLGPGEFFGEACLAGELRRLGSATAMTPSTILVVGRDRMVALLHQQSAIADHFIAHILARNIRIEEDLVDRSFHSSEKRLARTLLRLSHYGKQYKPPHTAPKISQGMLATMIGTTRPRVNVFLKKFQRLGFIRDTNGLKVHKSLRTVLHD
jgi:CRP/FNR family cyclic AMP-dependent transcriptional regulator